MFKYISQCFRQRIGGNEECLPGDKVSDIRSANSSFVYFEQNTIIKMDNPFC